MDKTILDNPPFPPRLTSKLPQRLHPGLGQPQPHQHPNRPKTSYRSKGIPLPQQNREYSLGLYHLSR